MQHLWPAMLSLLWLSFITGIVFPLLLLQVGELFFADQAAGSLVKRDGVVVGSRLIGQAFSKPEYFHPRPSAAGTGYDATSSGGSNLGPDNPDLVRDSQRFAQIYRAENDLAAELPIPIDAVTRSASGLDPHISPDNAALQVPRVARARRLSEAAVRRLVAEHVDARQLGFLGAPRVAVFDLNLALDNLAPAHGR